MMSKAHVNQIELWYVHVNQIVKKRKIWHVLSMNFGISMQVNKFMFLYNEIRDIKRFLFLK